MVPPSPSLASMSKFPSGGKNIEKTIYFFYDLYENRKNKNRGWKYNFLSVYLYIHPMAGLYIIWVSLVGKLSFICSPACGVPWAFLQFSAAGILALTSLKRFIFQCLWRVPQRGPNVFVHSTGSALDTFVSKRLQFYIIFCLHLSNLIVNTC